MINEKEGRNTGKISIVRHVKQPYHYENLSFWQSHQGSIVVTVVAAEGLGYAVLDLRH